MKTYPIMLVMSGRLAVVVGGGAVGLRRARSLRRAGARVRLVTHAPPGEAPADGVELVVEPYRAEHLAGAVLVFACTDDAALNARIAADARAGGALVNAADQPADCDFFLPAVVADGDVTVAVGTGGSAPALAAMLKRRLAAALGDDIGRFAAALAELRSELRRRLGEPERRGRILRQLADETALRLFRQGGSDRLRERMAELLRSDESPR